MRIRVIENQQRVGEMTSDLEVMLTKVVNTKNKEIKIFNLYSNDKVGVGAGVAATGSLRKESAGNVGVLDQVAGMNKF